jgi:CheY-like chemotaxis protein
MNLVDNAIKFTDRGSVDVEVTLAEQAAPETELVLRFSVNDSGIGIPAADRAQIFEAFAQVDASTTRKHGGAGLGLAIAARLVTLLGGTIGVDSELGRGSQFRFTVQLTRGAQVHVTSPALKREGEARPLKILVAEDNEFNIQLLQLMLERRGHIPSVCSTGDEALRLSEAHAFDLLLLDLHMPVLDGFQVIERIRAREHAAGEHLPVIALTARSRPEDRERCLAAGMDDFLSKPLRAPALWEAIERALAPRNP